VFRIGSCFCASFWRADTVTVPACAGLDVRLLTWRNPPPNPFRPHVLKRSGEAPPIYVGGFGAERVLCLRILDCLLGVPRRGTTLAFRAHEGREAAPV
jgi:hypothetical protein